MDAWPGVNRQTVISENRYAFVLAFKRRKAITWNNAMFALCIFKAPGNPQRHVIGLSQADVFYCSQVPLKSSLE